MKIDKVTILILILLLISVFDLEIRNKEYDNTIQSGKFMLLKKQLSKERLIAENQDKYTKQASVIAQEIEQIESKLFPNDMGVSSVQTEIQKQIKLSFEQENLKLENISWLDPVIKKESGYTNIPISFLVKGAPEKVMHGLKKLLEWEKLLSMPIYTIRKSSKKNTMLELRATIVGFKKNEI